MGLFDLFKKKTTDSTFPENELEIALMNAVTDASKRRDFFMKLLWSPLIIISADQTNEADGSWIAEAGTVLKLLPLPDGRIPIFSASNRIYDKGIIEKKPIKILTINARDLFATAKGTTFVLNPYSAYGKELIPEVIEALLSGSIFESKKETLITKKETPVRLAQPANYPVKLAEALSRLFEKRPIVNAAYLALIKWPDKEKPHVLIGLDSTDDISAIMDEAGPMAERILGLGEIIDITRVQEKDGVSNYLKTTKPFYTRI